jgi:hypothetical protein
MKSVCKVCRDKKNGVCKGSQCEKDVEKKKGEKAEE